ncbi:MULTISPECIES: RDD family protein [Corynebacterium]|uniref:RDD family protein n=1 Tax=Corynebacterium TaxID=1716 RepID=UPI00254AE9FF|nr:MULTISPECIES: RDD family protein [Corynebacterium]MDK6260828.1 RDD family protein [Corynebacterium frankenforstense]MDK8894427.1 RDD family protein [Corynebacterium sp. MSK006]
MTQPRRSWLDGPAIPSEYESESRVSAYPGELLGLPEHGPGALASVTRRAGGVLIDWIICWILGGFTHMFSEWLGTATYTYLYFLLLGFASCLFFARTPGQAVLGMGVARVDEPGRRVDLWRSAVRVLMTGTIFLAAMVDSDGRGVHDRVTGTAVIRG